MLTFPYKLLLASASPRRKQLMQGMDLDFSVVSLPQVDELSYPDELIPQEIPPWLAQAKSNAFPRPLAPDELLITADTLVFCPTSSPQKPIVLGKPADREQACQMLERLSGAVHQVITGVHLRTTARSLSFHDTTSVFFSRLDARQIAYYVDTYRPYDKAGAYGVQEWIGYVGIERIEGSYFNVMGLPVHKLWESLITFARFI